MKFTIGGSIGSGKSSVGMQLAKHFELDYISMGKVFREFGLKKGLDVTELTKNKLLLKELDSFIDDYQKNLNSSDNFLLDSRLGFHFVADSIKIFFYCDVDEAATRIFSDDRKSEHYSNVDELKQSIKFRDKDERSRFESLYGVDIRDPENFDIVIDTSRLSKEEVYEKLLKKVNDFISSNS